MSDSTQRPSKKVRLDQLDRKIVFELMRNARIANNALAAKLRVAPSTTLTRVRRLIDEKVIRGSHVSVDLKALGLGVQALVAIQLKPMARDQIRTFAQRAARLPMVRSMYYLGGGDLDFLIHVACPSTDNLTELVTEKLNADPVVAGTRTYLIFEHFDEVKIAEALERR
ncbi:MAG: Lrp/AsnC family transcriptional regulator [Actinomycetales bacterium]